MVAFVLRLRSHTCTVPMVSRIASLAPLRSKAQVGAAERDYARVRRGACGDRQPVRSAAGAEHRETSPGAPLGVVQVDASGPGPQILDQLKG